MKDKKRVKPVEQRFNRSEASLRSLHVSTDTKDLQKEIEWARREIQQYGFSFFPNLYVFDKVKEFERLVDELRNHPTTQIKKERR